MIGDALAVGSSAIGQGMVQATALEMTDVAATIAIAWVLAKSPDTVALVGSGRAGHVERNLEALEVRLEPAALTLLGIIIGVTTVVAMMALIEGLRNEVVSEDSAAKDPMPVPLTGFDDAVRAALGNAQG